MQLRHGYAPSANNFWLTLPVYLYFTTNNAIEHVACLKDHWTFKIIYNCPSNCKWHATCLKCRVSSRPSCVKGSSCLQFISLGFPSHSLFCLGISSPSFSGVSCHFSLKHLFSRGMERGAFGQQGIELKPKGFTYDSDSSGFCFSC